MRIVKGLQWLIHTIYVEEKQTGLLSYKQFNFKHLLPGYIQDCLEKKDQKKR